MSHPASDDLLARLPHRPPMRLIEQVVEVMPGAHAHARRRTRPQDWFFAGHFPDDPVIPAVVLIELIAQTGGLAAAAADDPQRAMRVAAVSDFKFPASAGADVALDVRARVVGRFGRLVKVEGTVTAGDRTLATGTVMLADVAAAPA
jgi:3-hydroxyacyl-[acyl-carrier-protein] dehydratase